jgi:hypothetical protein
MSEQAAEMDEAMKAFVAGWFAHARNAERLVVEDAWHAYRIGDLCPACLRKPCTCPVNDTAARELFERLGLPNPPTAAGQPEPQPESGEAG